MGAGLSLAGYPTLSRLTSELDSYLSDAYPDFFGSSPKHPVLALKPSKVIHDNLWGTNRFSWRELALIDSPLIQRLRDIHQVGLAFYVYPSAKHTRFEHCLGVVTLSSRIFDALLKRPGDIQDIMRAAYPGEDIDNSIRRLRAELRLAALLHDTGHSLFSHTSELVYEKLTLMRDASKELSRITAKEKGAGEVISFCLTQTNAVRQLIERARSRVKGVPFGEDFDGELDLANIALMIVGRSRHPYLQFLGDIVSSAFDSDKLDYLLRDAKAAGLPLRYDMDRYLYSVRLEKDILADDKGELQALYTSTVANNLERKEAGPGRRFPHYQTYRLRLPKEAMNTIEQMIICKMMLFSYLYHHPKVRAAEGLLARALDQMVDHWHKSGESEEKILRRFMTMTDSSLRGELLKNAPNSLIRENFYRLANRLLPREVYRLSGTSGSHAQSSLLKNFLTGLQDRSRRSALAKSLEEAIGEELLKIDKSLGDDPEEALLRAGVWLDVPKPPKFEDIDEIVVSGGVPIGARPSCSYFQLESGRRRTIVTATKFEFLHSLSTLIRRPKQPRKP